MSLLNIVHVSSRDIKGGAGRSAYRLHKGLLSVKASASEMFVLQKRSAEPSVTAFQYPSRFIERIRRFVYRRQISLALSRYNAVPYVDYDLFSNSRSELREEVLKQLPVCDVVNLHWVAKFIDYKVFLPAVSRLKPIVWTLHDMNTFTGGCHYDRGCGGFREDCGKCPQLKSNKESDLSRMIWQHKRSAFDAIPPGRLHVVTPSQWLADEAKRSALLKHFPVHVIPYGLNIHDFAPRGKTQAREILGIPKRHKVILFVAGSIKDTRKGLKFLLEALSEIDEEQVFVMTVGKAKQQLNPKISYQHMGQIDHDRFLSLVYSAADLFVIPSLQDNLPNTVMESMACGTPVVGFETGGIPDMVRSGMTGELVSTRNTKGLRAAILGLLNNPEKLVEMAKRCRRVVLEEYALDVQARRYIDLYSTLCDPSSTSNKNCE